VTFRLTGAGGPLLQAATVVLLRNGAAGVECLMLRKTKGQAFGGLWVFPGGRVESEIDGLGSDAARNAAVRELTEETGLVADPDDLVPVSHWTPPPEAPKRYATWFFLTALPEGAPDVVVDGGEIGDHLWTAPLSALRAHSRGEIELLPPTWITLQRLVGHPSVATALYEAGRRPPELFATRFSQRGDVGVALWAPDAAYPAHEDDDTPGDLDTPGPRHRLHMAPGGWRYERTDRAGRRTIVSPGTGPESESSDTPDEPGASGGGEPLT
jgi:8-oxo-dGTP pyrophosphatase MutT (NUDIX family)